MIKTCLNMRKVAVTPEFEAGEELIRTSSGTLDVGRPSLSSSWRPCNIYLTNRRLIVGQVRKIIKAFRFEQIQRVKVVERAWIAGKRVPQLEIAEKLGKINYIAVKDATSWLTEMAQLAGWNLDRSNVRPRKKKHPTARMV